MGLVAVVKWCWHDFQFASGFGIIDVSNDFYGDLLALLDESINVETSILDSWIVGDASQGCSKGLGDEIINIALSLTLLIGNLFLDIFNNS